MAVHPRHGRSASVVGRRFEPFKADRGQASQADVAKKRQRNGLQMDYLKHLTAIVAYRSYVASHLNLGNQANNITQ